ncbi:hypothetical protein [Chryseobacterium populi]|uniref:Uncharacterized protein n=1 Tax=Chryseobacterium populi TaxID=1144316 RepID=J2JP68_9FLAO|nr:hypothetical protein [Chryseobacterium populi]EJL69620.1 hypothetical protein PMI13_03193 [Chryseobacterium populi]
MEKILVISCMPGAKIPLAQVGINTYTPNATLDVVAKTTDGSKAEKLYYLKNQI